MAWVCFCRFSGSTHRHFFFFRLHQARTFSLDLLCSSFVFILVFARTWLYASQAAAADSVVPFSTVFCSSSVFWPWIVSLPLPLPLPLPLRLTQYSSFSSSSFVFRLSSSSSSCPFFLASGPLHFFDSIRYQIRTDSSMSIISPPFLSSCLFSSFVVCVFCAFLVFPFSLTDFVFLSF